jgi:hypothetical protein
VAAADAGGSSGSWQQQRQQPLHVLQGGMSAAAGVLGRQGKVREGYMYQTCAYAGPAWLCLSFCWALYGKSF